MARLIFLLLLCVAALAGTPFRAEAQETYPIIGMQCDADHNRVLIRFGSTPLAADADTPGDLITEGDFVPAPQNLTNGWEKTPSFSGGSCHFKNGQRITATTAEAGLFGYVKVYFGLSIDGHIVYDNIFAGDFDAGSGTDFTLAAIAYDGQKLTECLPGDGQNASSGPAKNVKCSDVSYRLATDYKFTTVDERAWWDQQQAQARLSRALPPFCKALANFASDPKNYPLSRVYNHNTRELYDYNLNGDEALSVLELLADFGNAGKLVPVFDIQYGPDDHLGNDVLIAFTKSPAAATSFAAEIEEKSALAKAHNEWPDYPVFKLTAAQKAASTEIGQQLPEETLGKLDPWQIGGFDTSWQRILFRFQGHPYVSSEFEGIFNEPSSTIQEILPDGSVKMICAFP